LGVAFYEAVEKEAVDALGLGIGGVTGIEVGGVGFDYEDEVSEIVLRMGAGGEDCREEKDEGSITQRHGGHREEKDASAVGV
jgi:hypothetical protein